MKLLKLIENLSVIETVGKTDVEISNVQMDSNAVNQGSLFICIKGEDYDGSGFIRQVENYGAVAIVCEKKLDTLLPQIIVANARRAMSEIAKNFYDRVCDKMHIIGVVGTNGKTTTAHLIGKILNDNGVKCGVIGTLGVFYGKQFYEPTLTTPDPLVLHKTLREMYQNGYKTVVMEVSAHALYYQKVSGLKFEVGVFTNCSRDHLDFFKDMESYKRAKKSFYIDNDCKFCVLNADDELGREIIETTDKKVVSFGMENPADVFAIDIEENPEKTKFIINLFDCVYKVSLPLMGRFNVYNALGAATACALMGVKPEKVVKSLKSATCASGRMQCIYNADFSVYVDYAHTPDGLKNLLTAFRKKKNRLVCVFGCGGNRDRGKRFQMGQISGEFADFTIITSDNPRYEEPMDIIYEIEKGLLTKSKNYIIIQDRAEAIKYALSMAKAGDVIVVAGKGSENYQEILGIKRPYNDKDTIEEILRGLRS